MIGLKFQQEAQGFFRSLGFEISYEDARLGILETNWLSNRAYRNIGFWKSLVGGLTVTGLKDRYRVRLERSDDPNITRVYLVHQGLIEDVHEEYSGATISRFWRWRPNDPELEAELLQRFLVFRGLDEWIRHRLRAIQLKQWKRGRTVFRELRSRGMSRTAAAKVAANARRWWRNSAMAINIALPKAYFDGLGVPRLAP